MNLPAIIRIGHLDLKVVEWTATKGAIERRFGEFSAVEGEIRVETDNRAPMDVLGTLLHEITHAICWVYEVRTPDKLDKDEHADTEERLCGIFSTAWAQIYRDNPALVEFIGESAAKAARHGKLPVSQEEAEQSMRALRDPNREIMRDIEAKAGRAINREGREGD